MGLDNNNIHGVDDALKNLSAAKQYLDKNVNKVIGVEAVNHFKESFQNEGFTDNNLKKWDSRRTKRIGGTNNQKTLSQTGELGDSIDYKVDGRTTIIYSDKIYAEIHNEGGEITVTPKMRKFFWAKSHEAKEAGDAEVQEQYKFMALSKVIKIKQTKFMGESEELNRKIISKIERDLTNIFKS